MATKPRPKAPQPDLRELGGTGLRHDRFTIREEYAARLQGQALMKKYREMRDASWAVGAFSWLLESLVRQVEWKVERPNDSAEARALEALVESARCDMEQSWQEMISEILSFANFGFCTLEKVYKYRAGEVLTKDGQRDKLRSSKYTDGAIGWGALAPRAQESLAPGQGWRFDDDGRVTHMRQQCEPDMRLREIPMGKLLLFRPRSAKNSPEGRAFGRNAIRPWDYEKRFEEMEAAGVAKDFVGTMIVEVPSSVFDDPAKLAEWEERARKVDRNEYEGIVFPAPEQDGQKTGYGIRLLQGGGSRQMDLDTIIRRCESRILIVHLCDFLSLGQEHAGGSYAMNDSKTNVFTMSTGAVLGSIREPINDDAIPELARFNGYMDPANYPRLTHGDIETPELTQLADYLSKLIPTGAVDLNAAVRRHVHNFANLPPPDEGTPVPKDVKPAPANDPPQTAPGTPPKKDEPAAPEPTTEPA